jgi:IS30 family transposase
MHKPLTVAEKERLAELVAANTPLAEICEVIGRDRWTTRRNINYLARRPAPERTRSPLRLSLAEREEISRGVAAGESLRSIARRLGRSPSTVSREVAGNGGARRYRAVVADRAALKRARRPKPAKLAVQAELCALVESKLELRWSPQQISGWLSETFPDRPEMQVSHETIYLSLFVQSRGALRKELTRYLRRGQATRRPRGRRAYDGGRGKIRAMVHISERPAEAEDRAVPGHWEGDLVFGTARSAMATLVERHSRFVMLVGLPNGHTADVVAEALSAKIAELPERLRGSITWDQGKEMARHARFSVNTGVPVYFCDPHSPWQRGSNENTNGLLRQYFPKRTPLPLDQAALDAVADELNGRPRQTLGWKTPSEVLDQALR